MDVGNQAWVYMCACGDINTDIAHVYVSMYVHAYMLYQCIHLGM